MPENDKTIDFTTSKEEVFKMESLLRKKKLEFKDLKDKKMHDTILQREIWSLENEIQRYNLAIGLERIRRVAKIIGVDL
jgi:hypothetical protein